MSLGSSRPGEGGNGDPHGTTWSPLLSHERRSSDACTRAYFGNGTALLQRNRSMQCRTVPLNQTETATADANLPGVGLRCFIRFGFIGLRFREVKGPFSFLLLEELQGQLAPLDGAPEGRHDIFTLQTGHFFPPSLPPLLQVPLESDATAHLTGRKGETIDTCPRAPYDFKMKVAAHRVNAARALRRSRRINLKLFRTTLAHSQPARVAAKPCVI